AAVEAGCAPGIIDGVCQYILPIDRTERWPEQPGEIAAYHRLGGDRHESAISQVLYASTGACYTCALVVAEHEQLVLDDGKAKRSAELILFECIPILAALIVFPAVGIELLVLEKLEYHAMHGV